MTPTSSERFVLHASCTDAIGIVADVADFLTKRRPFIVETADFGDPQTERFLLRIVLAPDGPGFTATAFSKDFAPIGEPWGMEWELRDMRAKPNVLILVSKADHCLNDLLYRHRIGALAMNTSAIVSNHPSCAWLAERHGIPYCHIPIERDGKQAAETRILELAEASKADLVVLAQYTQVLAEDTCRKLEGRCINIHHSFLLGFKGASPYTQALTRGGKLIGATAHYLTPDLDEGPIIAQAVEPAAHTHTPDMLAAIGRDIEPRVLASAVKLHIEGRLFLNGSKTVMLD